jgi:predicted  nucleic acid-binding Zn-ribbon protein
LDESIAKARTTDLGTQEIEELSERNHQLELLLRTADERKKAGSHLEQQLQAVRNQLVEKDSEMDNVRTASATQYSQLQDWRRKLDEVEQKAGQLPNIEAQSAAMVDQLKIEQAQLLRDLKQKGSSLQSLNERITEAQRNIRDLQGQLQRARDDASNFREDAIYHRAKSEEIQRRASEQTKTYVRDANSAVQNLQQQLDDKTKECEVYQKLLSDARRQLAPLAEAAVPQLRSQIARIASERESLVRRVKRLIQFSVYVEQAVKDHPESPDALAFNAALRQLKEEMEVFDK